MVNEEKQFWLDHDFILDLINRLPSHVFWKNKEGVFIGCNDAFAQSLGLSSAKEVIGKTDYDLPTKPEESDAFRKDDIQVMESRRPKLNIEEEQTFPDGRKVFLLTSKTPLFNKKKEVVGVLGIYTDITELKKTQLALLKAKEQAEIANQAKTEFISNMSHDIRTPITGMLGIINDWKDRATAEEDKQDAKLLEGCANELLNLLNEVLDVVKIESDEFRQKEVEFTLTELVDHNIILLMSAAKNKGIELKTNLASAASTKYIGKKILIDRILLNLISNAIKFTHEGHVSIIVSLEEQKENIAIIKIVIEDTGIGMPKEKLQLIFDKFTRLTSSYDGIYKGAGLGLYAVKKLVKLLDGKIDVDSEEDKGSKFIITLPLKIAKADKTKTHQTIKTSTPIKTTTPDIKILLVEDNLLAARSAKSILTKLNCIVDIAYSAKDALTYINDNDYQLIFMDLGLPDQTGFEVAKIIRRLNDKKKASLPVIALTGHVGNDRKAECINHGMNDMVTKPLSSKLAQNILEHWINRKDLENKNRDSLTIKTSAVIDLDIGAEIVGSKEQAKSMLMMLADTLPKDIQKVEEAYEKQNYSALLESIHRIYGGICYCGVPQLKNIIESLHTVLEQENKQRELIDKLYKDLRNGVNVFFKELKQLSESKKK